MTVLTAARKPSLVYHATYGGADGLDEIHGMLSRENGSLMFLADSGELFFPSDLEWYLYGQTHGEVGLSTAQALTDARRARIERQMLEASNRLEAVV
jgi:hypothetical protein